MLAITLSIEGLKTPERVAYETLRDAHYKKTGKFLPKWLNQHKYKV